MKKTIRRQLQLFSADSPYLEQVQTLVSAASSGTVTLSFASVHDSAKTPSDRVKYQRLLLNEATSDTMRSIVMDNLIDLQERLQDGLLVRAYAGGIKQADDEIEFLDISSEPRIMNQIDQLRGSPASDLFTGHKRFMKGLRYYVITIMTTKGSPIHCFRFYSEAYELQRSRWLALLNWRGDGYYDVVRDPGFLFDREIDCVCADNSMFILNKAKFQQVFRFYERVQHDASNAVKKLHERVPLANLEDIIAATKRDSRMAIRLAELPNQPHFRRLTMSRLKGMINRRQELRCVRTEVREGIEMLVYSSEYKAEFLRLLCDDYVTSRMTFLDYEATAKRPLKPRRREKAAFPRLQEVS